MDMQGSATTLGAYTLAETNDATWHAREQKGLDDESIQIVDADASGCELRFKCSACGTRSTHKRMDGRTVAVGELVAWRNPNCCNRPAYRVRVARLVPCADGCLCSRLRATEQRRIHRAALRSHAMGAA